MRSVAACIAAIVATAQVVSVVGSPLAEAEALANAFPEAPLIARPEFIVEIVLPSRSLVVPRMKTFSIVMEPSAVTMGRETAARDLTPSHAVKKLRF
ncbi:hypothetical protein PRK78_002698 [Emydomyces testavorans]|uniref:Uncharacterized protein n=1 Tax=Emydomyces testavorans TaxID=2070801 RepID=A0AAF0DFE1_9EURO|nr:hypothetical protein PRK78_002698 [Emydomyces testavorans]